MLNYLSPYIKPDEVVQSPQGYFATNPYSYNQFANVGKMKIGVSTEEQRLLYKKIVRICDGILYVMKNWTECRIQLELKNYESVAEINFKSFNLFKCLIDEYV